MRNGTIFDIKEFSIHDGPGVRITVFMKGCPLRCLWCHNPEGFSVQPQLMYKKNLCTNCGKCFLPCNHPECAPFNRCIHACQNGCLSVSGQTLTSNELTEKLLSYQSFLSISDGGITFSGGEPLLQADFILEVAKQLPHIHKAIQTSGFSDFETYKKTIDGFDYILQDIKIADDVMHKKYTGVSNRNILENIEYLKQIGKPFVLRLPLIPGITDTEENLKAVSQIAGDFPVELLRYNMLAGVKYEMLGLRYPLSDIHNSSKDYTRFFKNAILK